ncbi:MAG: MBL fold metallo-hydrolase [Candidatus Micrarchaeia archaeon]|jgi:ribonuclease J
MTSLTFYGGASEIGGNKILVEDRKTRIFLDFGQSFSLLDGFFVPEAFLSPRDRFGLKDFFEFGLVPKLRGLYCEKALENSSLPYDKEAAFDAIFVSHPHFDHVAHLEYLHPDIPVYMGEATKTILDSTEETTRQKFCSEDSCVKTFRSGQTQSVGNLKVTPIHVDHSVPGAYGFLIETSEGTIAYTGDFRLHGPKSSLSQDFLDKAKAADPQALIIEGTRVSAKETRKNHSEETVETESRRVISKSDELVITMRYPKDLDRFQTFYKLAKETDRTLVISMKTAHLLESLKNDPHIKLPDPFSDKNLKVYYRQLKVYKKWQQQMISKCVDAAFVSENQKTLVLEADFYYLTELIDIQPKAGDCIHSMSEPFEEDPISQISDEVLDNWCNHFKLRRHQLHASGHASKDQILSIADSLNAKKVFPIHTNHPDLFRTLKTKTILPIKNQAIEI